MKMDDDDDDRLEGLKDRARIIRDAAPKSGSITPLEITAEHIEWAITEIERLRKVEESYEAMMSAAEDRRWD